MLSAIPHTSHHRRHYHHHQYLCCVFPSTFRWVLCFQSTLLCLLLSAHVRSSGSSIKSLQERLYIETLREQLRAEVRRDSQDKGGSMTAAAVGASLGAGLGLVLTVVMGAASALGKP